MGLTVAVPVTIRLPDESLLRTVAAEQPLLVMTTSRHLERRSSDGAEMVRMAGQCSFVSDAMQ